MKPFSYYKLLPLPLIIAFCASLIFAFSNHSDFFPETVLIGILSLLIISVFIMFIELKKSLKETLYLYKNIMLIGGIIFLITLTVALSVYFIPSFFTKGISLNLIYKAIIGFPREFSYYAVFIMTAICILVGISNIVLMKKEGYHLHNALSILVAVLYIGGTIAIYILNDFLDSIERETPILLLINTAIPLFCLLMLCYFECILAGTAIMGYKAAHQVPTYDKDYIIILGCSIDKRGGLLPLLKGRVNRAIRFAWEQEMESGKPLKYVPSGGKGSNEVISEGSAMELYLLTHGAENNEVFPEKKSRNTYENMLFSKKIIDELNPNAKIAFATTNYHILRSGILARKVGIDAEGIAGDTKWYFWPNGFIREFFGILVLNIKEHIIVAAIIALISLFIGIIAYLGI